MKSSLDYPSIWRCFSEQLTFKVSKKSMHHPALLHKPNSLILCDRQLRVGQGRPFSPMHKRCWPFLWKTVQDYSGALTRILIPEMIISIHWLSFLPIKHFEISNIVQVATCMTMHLFPLHIKSVYKWMRPTYQKVSKEFPGGPVVRTLCFHYQGLGFHPWLGN